MNKEKLKNIFFKILKLLGYVVIAFVCFCVAFLVYYIISSQMHANDENYKPAVSIYTIVSPSMTPVIKVYDVVVNTRVKNPEKIQVGDIITYVSKAPTSEGMTITHRVVEISQLPDGTYEFMTQGDNNSEPDSLYVKFDQVIGKEILILPLIGRLQFLIANQKGWLFLLLIPISIYVLFEIYKLIDLLGLRRRVNTVVGVTEESLIERKKEQRQIEKERKIAIKEELNTKSLLRESLIRNEEEPEGFLERYNETTVSVVSNKYKKITKKEKPVKTIATIPTKVSTGKNIPVKEKVELELELPKIKENPYVINKPIEILDTDELTTKIKEYDTKIEKLDKMINDIESIPVSEKKEEIVEKNDYLTKKKIKVKKVEPTKNQKKPAPVRKTKKKEETKVTFKPELTQTIELSQILPKENKRIKIEKPVTEDIKEVGKKDLEVAKETKSKKKLNLNPTSIKTVSRSRKKKVEEAKLDIETKPIPEKQITVEIDKKPVEDRKINIEINRTPVEKKEINVTVNQHPVEERKIKVEVEKKEKVEPFITMDDVKKEEPKVKVTTKRKYPPLIEIKKIK